MFTEEEYPQNPLSFSGITLYLFSRYDYIENGKLFVNEIGESYLRDISNHPKFMRTNIFAGLRPAI